ncbi:MAG: peptide chain release factor N(5)-glutamine methyltransferase [Holophagales bacterium]|nr:peptide chain release factor N(5)-glutamine methyltransferase [Holophagales bacterium]MYG30822.1 peptide chain release factor N(5)-glutamine methyltransferase [Holophagales bacterium]MYI81762.1 peptide chain release factor N(5)-glutamine methyltransferase [Holophagales bacterium]
MSPLSPAKPPPGAARVVDLLDVGQEHLAGLVEQPRREAALLLGEVLRLSEAQLYARADDDVPEPAAVSYGQLIRRRADRIPVAYLLGRREFHGRVFAVDPRVLIPRPETEHLVEAALNCIDDGARVLDVGTGSGCIAVTLALERPGSRIVATDLSPGALAVAAANCRRHGVADRVRLVRADLLSALRPGAFDIVVSNPPYIDVGEWPSLMPEVRDHEPPEALFAGDGLDFYRRLFADGGFLREGQRLLLEIGKGQLEAVRELAEGSGFDVEWVVADLAGIARVLTLRRG